MSATNVYVNTNMEELGVNFRLHLETIVYGRMTATGFVNSRENS